MQLGELCRRLNVPNRQARYVLEEGILPRGVEESPGRGEHRDLSPAQAFWLGIVLLLKQSGVRTPMAGKIADFARLGVRSITQNLNWERPFEPFLGRLETANCWFLDIGDLKFIRMATNANPSYDGLYEFPWSRIGRTEEVKTAKPIIILRVDLGRLAMLLRA